MKFALDFGDSPQFSTDDVLGTFCKTLRQPEYFKTALTI